MATIIDASGLVLGRMATVAAKKAREGEQVHIVNAEKAIITGSSKRAIQDRYKFKREVGTSRKGPFFPREPHLIVKRTCRGMLQYQKPSGREAYKRIKAYIGVPRELAGQKFETVEAARRDPDIFMTIAELSTSLGRHTEPWVAPEASTPAAQASAAEPEAPDAETAPAPESEEEE